MNFEEFIKFLVTNTVTAVIIIFLGKQVIQIWFSKDLENFKSELEKEAIKLKIRYESLHTERAKVVKELYSKIINAEYNISSTIKPLQLAGEKPKEEKVKKSVKALKELINYFEQNKIFLDEALEKKVEKLVNVCADSWVDFSVAQILKEYQDKESIDKWRESWEKFKEEAPKARKEIIQEFREIIGIENK